MDIRLIFRNRRRTAHDEPRDAKRLKPAAGHFPFEGVAWPAERATQAGSSQAMERRRKVASAWRWLSTSKGVGSDIGKSVSHIS